MCLNFRKYLTNFLVRKLIDVALGKVNLHTYLERYMPVKKLACLRLHDVAIRAGL